MTGPIDTRYQPILRYQRASGEVRQFIWETGRIATESPYHQGDQLPVLYDPDGVLSPRIKSFYSLWGIHLGLIAQAQW